MEDAAVAREETKRPERVAERIREELMRVILRGEIRSPGAEGVIVTAVKCADDLGVARVFVRLLDDDGDNGRKRKRALEALAKAAPFLRREVTKGLRIRSSPELRFEWDDVIDSARRMEELLHEIRTESPDPKGEGKK
jgi:ribosome-binding factor A